MKTLLSYSLALVSFSCLAACAGSDPVAASDSPAPRPSYALRGGVALAPQPGTTFDADELASRNGYGATLTDTTGNPWFTRVETVSAERLQSLELQRVEVGGADLLLGSTSDGDGNADCHVLRRIDGDRFVAMTRPADGAGCPQRPEDVDAWLPEVALIDSPPQLEDVGEAQQALSYGSYVGSFLGVSAYSNGSTSYASGTYSCCGLQWQCVEYDNRFYVNALGHQNLKGTGNANNYFGTASSKGLLAYANGSSVKPRAGDMLVSNGGTYGHIAVIRDVGSNYVTVINQNWANDASDNAKTLSMSVSNGYYTVSGFSASYPIAGWMRRNCTPTVSSVYPTTATLNQTTTFTVTGSCLPASTAFYIPDCVNPVITSLSNGTQAQFTCTPSYTSGVKSGGVVKDQPGGTVLQSFSVTVY